MPEHQFTSTYTYDLSYHRSFYRAMRMMAGILALGEWIWIVLFYLSLFTGTPTVWICAVGMALFLLAALQRRAALKKQHRRTVMNNADQIPEVEVRISSDGIAWQESPLGGKHLVLPEHVRRIGESDDLILLRFDHGEVLSVDKRTLTGGTPTELIQFLIDRCNSLRIRRTLTPRWFRLRRTLLYSGAIGCVAVSLVFSLLLKPQRDLAASVAYRDIPTASTEQTEELQTAQQAAVLLETLGFDPIDAEIIEQAQEQLGWTDFEENAVPVLLGSMGTGQIVYDENGVSSDKILNEDVYSFTLYAGVIADSIYTEILEGVAQICGKELSITDVRLENQFRRGGISAYSNIWISTVSFCLNGQQHTLRAKTEEPWVDLQFLNDLAAILREASAEEQLYFSIGNYRGDILIFCRDAAWAAEFEQATGLPLFTEFTKE